MEHIAIDLGGKESQICIRDQVRKGRSERTQRRPFRENSATPSFERS